MAPDPPLEHWRHPEVLKTSKKHKVLRKKKCVTVAPSQPSSDDGCQVTKSRTQRRTRRRRRTDLTATNEKVIELGEAFEKLSLTDRQVVTYGTKQHYVESWTRKLEEVKAFEVVIPKLKVFPIPKPDLTPPMSLLPPQFLPRFPPDVSRMVRKLELTTIEVRWGPPVPRFRYRTPKSPKPFPNPLSDNNIVAMAEARLQALERSRCPRRQ